MPRTQIRYEQGGTIEVYPPEGRPDSAASLTIYVSGSSELSGTWPATVSLDSASTTTDAAASQHTTQLSVVDASSFVARRRRYWLETTDGRTAEVVLDRVDTSSNDLYLDQPLRFGVASGSTISGHRLAYTLSSSQAGTLRRRLRAEWSYDVDGETYYLTTYLDVVREPWDLSRISESDIEIHDSSWGEYADSQGRWRDLVVGAADDVERMLRAEQVYPDLVRDREGLEAAVIYRVLAKRYAQTPSLLERAEHYAKAAEQAVADVLEARTWYDVDEDHVGGDGRAIRGYTVDGDPIYEDGDEIGGDELEDELGMPAAYMRVG